MKKEDEIILKEKLSQLQEVINFRQFSLSASQKKLENLLVFFARKGMKSEINSIVDAFSVKELKEWYIRISSDNSLEYLSSFKSLLTIRSAARKKGKFCPEWIVDDKRTAFSFVKTLGVPVPEIFGVFDKENLVKNIPNQPCVIKPINAFSSKGVFVINEGAYWDVEKRLKLNSIDDVFDYVEKSNYNEWLVEEFVESEEGGLVPPKDIKFYTFYGKIALCLEVSRFPNLAYCWWDSGGLPVKTGRYEDNPFDGAGFTEQAKEYAIKISQKIPAPFVRVDFLKGKEKIVFGEITPRPGGYHEFNSNFDKILGEYFIDAENRLHHDMMNGKKFQDLFVNRLNYFMADNKLSKFL